MENSITTWKCTRTLEYWSTGPYTAQTCAIDLYQNSFLQVVQGHYCLWLSVTVYVTEPAGEGEVLKRREHCFCACLRFETYSELQMRRRMPSCPNISKLKQLTSNQLAQITLCSWPHNALPSLDFPLLTDSLAISTRKLWIVRTLGSWCWRWYKKSVLGSLGSKGKCLCSCGAEVTLGHSSGLDIKACKALTGHREINTATLLEMISF